MNTSGEVADQVVRMSLNGVEVAAKITGAGAKQLAVMLYSIMKEQKKTKGKTRLESMLKNGKELKVFAVKKDDLKKFTTEAKHYGVLYCVLSDKNGSDGLTDIFVRAEDASKINRIFERFKLAVVDTASIKSDIEKNKTAKDSEKQPPEREVSVKNNEEEILDQLIETPKRETPVQGKPVQSRPSQKEQAQNQNPTTAQTAKSFQSEPSSKKNDKAVKGIFKTARERVLEHERPSIQTRPSVREELSEIKAEKVRESISEKEDNTPQKNNQHKAPRPKKQKPKKTIEKG